MKKEMLLPILAALTLSPPVLAAEPAQPLRIGLDGIDLAAPHGMEAAQRRIDRAVARFCRNDVEHLTFKARRAARQCRESVRADALAQLRVRTCQWHVRGLKRFCSALGGKAQEYVDISRLADDAMDKIGQIPKGRRNGFDLGPARPCG